MNIKWREEKLQNLINNFDYKRIPVKDSDRKPGPFPYYGASGIADYINEYIFEGEYLLIAEDGENLRTRNTPIAFLAYDKFWVNNHAHVVTGNEKALTRFLLYYLNCLDISGHLTGSTIPKLSQRNLNSIKIKLPPIEIQKDIVSVISALDNKIQLNQQMNKTLESIARTLFKSWFIDFDPVRAKMAGREPEFPPEIVALFPDKLVDSPLGEIPEGWGFGDLSEVVLQYTNTLNPSDFPDEMFSYHSLPAYDLGKNPVLEKGSLIKSIKTIIPKNAVILSKLNPEIPRVWLTHANNENRAISSTEFLVYTPKEKFSKEYLYCLFQSSSFRALITGMVTGTSKSHQRVQAKSILKIKSIYPNDKLLMVFEKICSSLFEKMFYQQQQVLILFEIQKRLLPMLISGQLNINNTE